MEKIKSALRESFDLLRHNFLVSVGWTSTLCAVAMVVLMITQLLIEQLPGGGLRQYLTTLVRVLALAWATVIFLKGLKALADSAPLGLSVVRTRPVAAPLFVLGQLSALAITTQWAQTSVGLVAKLLSLSALLLAIVLTVGCTYVLPLLVLQNTSLLACIRRSFQLSLRQPFTTLAAMLVLWLTLLAGVLAFGVGALVAMPLAGFFWTRLAVQETPDT